MMARTFTYRRLTIRVDGSIHDEQITLDLPYAYNGRWFDVRNIGEVIAFWNASSMPEYKGRLINRYEYTLIDPAPTS